MPTTVKTAPTTYVGTVTMTPSGQEKYNYGQEISIKVEELVPLTKQQFWSAFDDYLELQKAISGHDDLALDTSDGRPANGVAATVFFTSPNGGRTTEILTEKDDVANLWTITVPEPNNLFTRYQGKAAIECVNDDGLIASYTFTVVLASPDKRTRTRLIDESQVPPLQGGASSRRPGRC